MENKIKAYRTKSKLSRRELAEKVGVTSEAIGHYENGKREPKASILKKIAKELGCLMEELI